MTLRRQRRIRIAQNRGRRRMRHMARSFERAEINGSITEMQSFLLALLDLPAIREIWGPPHVYTADRCRSVDDP